VETEFLPITCPCKAGWKEEDDLFDENALIWQFNGVVRVRLYVRRCKKETFDCISHFQGNSLGLFNHTSKHIFAYTMFHSYLNMALTAGMSFQGFSAYCHNMYEAQFGCFAKLDSRIFAAAFFNFAAKLKAQNLNFRCIKCGLFPKVFGVDGTDVGFPKKWSNLTDIKSSSFQHSNNTIVPFQNKIYVKSLATRELLLKLASREKMTTFDFENLNEKLQSEHPALFKVVYNLCSKLSEQVNIPESWRQVLHFLGSSTSLNRLIPSKFTQYIRSITQSD
jgi:hypothetical protein